MAELRRAARSSMVALALLLAAPIGPAGARQGPPSSPHGAASMSMLQSLRFPSAFVIADAATGAVISGLNDRVPRPPGSTTKILTALVVRRRADSATPVKVSARAASMPARRLSLRAGETWRAGDLLRAMLICSCNDAAVALAEAAGGTLRGFEALSRDLARDLGLRDRPTLQDPSGLDDEFSVDGGNLISARDLAIAARAFLNDDLLAGIAVAPSHRFRGGDGELHEVKNHNRLLGRYPGAIGVKSGYTRRSGSSLVAAARRGGRTIIVVVLDSPDVYLQAGQLLDIGFATPVRDLDRFPRLTVADERAGASPASPRASSPTAGDNAKEVATSSGDGDGDGDGDGGTSSLSLVAVVVAALVAAVALRRRHVVRRRRRRRAAARARVRSPP